MRQKFYLMKAAMLVAMGSLFFSCDSDDEQPVEEPSAVATVSILRTGDVSDTSLSVTFQPSENTTKWVYALGEADQQDIFRNDAMDGMVTTEGNAILEKTFEGLQPSTTYTVYAKAYNEKGIVGGIAVLKFPTEATFDVEQEYLLSTSMGMKMKFNEKLYKCRYYLGTSDDKEAFLNDKLEDDVELSERTEYTANFFDLTPNSDYVFYAVAYDRSNAACAFIEMPVTTYGEGVVPSGVLTPGADNDPYKGTYTVNCDNVGKMVGTICPKGGYETMINSDVHWKGDIVAMLQSWENLPGQAVVAVNGEPLVLSMDTPELKTDVELEAFVLLYDTENKPVGVQHFDFINVAKKENVPLPKVTLTVDEITTTGGIYTITPDENTWGILFNTLDADWYDEVKNSSDWYELYIPELLLSNGQWWSYKPGEPFTYVENTGEPGKRYYAVACPMNVNGVGGWGEITIVEYTSKTE